MTKYQRTRAAFWIDTATVALFCVLKLVGAINLSWLWLAAPMVLCWLIVLAIFAAIAITPFASGFAGWLKDLCSEWREGLIWIVNDYLARLNKAGYGNISPRYSETLKTCLYDLAKAFTPLMIPPIVVYAHRLARNLSSRVAAAVRWIRQARRMRAAARAARKQRRHNDATIVRIEGVSCGGDIIATTTRYGVWTEAQIRQVEAARQAGFKSEVKAGFKSEVKDALTNYGLLQGGKIQKEYGDFTDRASQ